MELVIREDVYIPTELDLRRSDLNVIKDVVKELAKRVVGTADIYTIEVKDVRTVDDHIIVVTLELIGNYMDSKSFYMRIDEFKNWIKDVFKPKLSQYIGVLELIALYNMYVGGGEE